ncbi:DUF7837 family putative zinc-binding protein [Halovenus rubra]|uniref:DUF7837 family putative zinc-binding protein n=1 Tax=Halovenus rubra TaxID=869890 RepID=UPI003F642612
MEKPHTPYPLGRCPECESKITSEQLVLKFKPKDGTVKTLAFCNNCGEVIPPV